MNIDWIKKRKESFSWKALCNRRGIFGMASAALLLYQIFLIIYANLTQLKYHLGFDASSAYIHTMEMWKTKQLIPDTFALTTTLGWDSPDPLAAVFYGITGNIFTSFGLANLVFVAAMGFVLYHILKEFGLRRLSICLTFNFFLCPLMILDNINDNNLSYFAMMLAEQGSYMFKVLTMLVAVLVVVKLEHGKKCYASIVILTLMNIVTSMSSGLYVTITILVPCLLYYVIKIAYENRFRKQTLFGAGLIFVQCVLSYIFKNLAVSLTGFVSRDGEMFLTGIENFWSNLGAVALGYFRLVGSITLYSDMTIFSGLGVLKLVCVAIVMIVFIMAVVSIVKLIKTLKEKDKDIIWLLPHLVIFVNVMVFILCSTTYDSVLFECRYYIIVYLMLSIIFAGAVQLLSDEWIGKYMLIGAMVVMLLMQTTGMFYAYRNDRIEYDDLTELLSDVDDLDTPVCYIWGDSFLVTGRNIRPMDTSVIYKIIDNSADPNNINHFGDYIYNDENADWQGSTGLITTEDEYYTLPEYLRNHYKYVTTVGRFALYKADNNPFDLSLYKSGNKLNFNYMYTHGMIMAGGAFDKEGNYVTDGIIAGDVMTMPLEGIEDGTYDFTLNYEIVSMTEEKLPQLTITDQDGKQIAGAELTRNGSSVSIKSVDITSDVTQITVKCVNTSGTVMKLKSIQFENNK